MFRILNNLKIAMKINLYLVLIFLLACNLPSEAQTNTLTTDQFFEIKFNSIALSDFYDEGPPFNNVNNWLQPNYNSSEGTDPLRRAFWDNDLYVRYEDYSESGTNYTLAHLRVLDTSVAVLINGITVKVGDNVSILGSDVLIRSNNESNQVIYVPSGVDATSISIEFNKVNNLITGIEYNYYE